jgi:hypothetical protein
MLAAPQSISDSAPVLKSSPTVRIGGSAETAAGALQATGLQMILQIERDVRRVKTPSELTFLMANELRRAVGARQIFILEGPAKQPQVKTVSSLSSVERNTPVIAWVESSTARLLALSAPDKLVRGSLRSSDEKDSAGQIFPFPEAMVAPVVSPSGVAFGFILAVRESPFADTESMLLQRLAETCGHAWAALGGNRKPLLARLRKPLPILAGMVALLALGFIPVPMTALAPVEVGSLDPVIVSAPLDGAIDQIPIDPNQTVKAGDILFRYIDTQSRGALDVAAREVSVAEAKLRQISQMAFVDPAAKRELAIARTELQLKRTEHAFALDVHERTIVRAPKDGIAVFPDKRELVGRPVNTGQRVMELADASHTQFRLQVPADDAMVLKETAKVRVFMDSDPLNPLHATITRASTMLRQSDGGALVFKAEAKLDTGVMPPLGHRGTAQVSGDMVSLAFYLFRRPIASLRQRTGL